MKKFTEGFSRLTSVVTVGVILLAALFVLPGFFGIHPYIVRSGSMEPVIHTGAVAFVNHRDRDVRAGDIITYRLPGPSGADTLVTHRVVGGQNGVYITRGDANQTDDLSPVTDDQVLGTYVCQIPYAGYIMAGMNRKTGVVAAVWILLINGASIAMNWAVTAPSRQD